METQPDNRSTSELIISHDVIAAIAVNAAKDVPGVGHIVQRPNDVRSVVNMLDGAQRYVEVTEADRVYNLKLHLFINEGEKIPGVASSVQKAVKNAVQSMTGSVVSKVNVVVAGVDIAETAPNQEKTDD